MRVYISAAVILRLAVSCWTTRRAEYYVQAEWQTGGAEPDTAGGEQSELFKAANQSSNFSVCVCVHHTAQSHTHEVEAATMQNMQHIKARPWKNSWASNERIPGPRWNIGILAEVEKRPRKTELMRGGALCQSDRQKIALPVWGGDQVAARHRAKPCLSSTGAEIRRSRTTGSRFVSPAGVSEWGSTDYLCKLESCHVHFLVKNVVFCREGKLGRLG